VDLLPSLFVLPRRSRIYLALLKAQLCFQLAMIFQAFAFEPAVPNRSLDRAPWFASVSAIPKFAMLC